MTEFILPGPDAIGRKSGGYQQQADNVGEAVSEIDTILSGLTNEQERGDDLCFEEKYAGSKSGFISVHDFIMEMYVAADIENADTSDQLRA